MLSKLCNFLVVSLFVVLFGACKNDDSTPEPPVLVGRDRTVLVYIVGDNSIARFIDDDIAEMVEGMKSVDISQSNLLVYLDSYSAVPTLFHVTKNKKGEVVKEVVKEYPEQVSTSADVMLDVMNRAFNEYPSDSYGLVYWSHAEGWLPNPLPSTRWVGDDNGNYMNISTLGTVLEQTEHLDFILFDACFMVSIEVAYELRHYADYFISSPTETPGTGAPYQVVIPAMFTEGSSVENIAETYMKPYIADFDDTLPIGHKSPFGANGEWVAGVSIGILKSDELDRLASITKQVLPKKITNNSKLRSSVFNYDKRSGSNVGYYDMVALIRDLTEDKDYLEWVDVFYKARPFWNATKYCYSDWGGSFSISGTNGVSHYIPSGSTSRNAAYRATQWYKDTGLSELGW